MFNVCFKNLWVDIECVVPSVEPTNLRSGFCKVEVTFCICIVFLFYFESSGMFLESLTGFSFFSFCYL